MAVTVQFNNKTNDVMIAAAIMTTYSTKSRQLEVRKKNVVESFSLQK